MEACELPAATAQAIVKRTRSSAEKSRDPGHPRLPARSTGASQDSRRRCQKIYDPPALLSTAQPALEFCRKIFGVPGSLTQAASFAANLLIKQRAKLVTAR